MMETTNYRYHKGFTLIEVMVVVVILGILASLILPRIMDRPEDARRTKAQLDIQSISQGLDLYKLDNHKYPTTEQGLKALIEKPQIEPVPKYWKQGGYLPHMPKDPWDNSYLYLSPGLHGPYDIISYGADGESGGEGDAADVLSWQLE